MAITGQTRKVRYAVVGAGNIAQVAVLPAFEHAAENSELVAIVSGDADKRAELARRFRVSRVASYDEYDDLVRSGDIDAVYIALPNTLHRDYTERAARAGVHILCEKPMAMTGEDCVAMIRAAEEGGVRLMIAYRLHFEQANLEAIELARSGVLGESRAFSSVFTQEVRPGDIRTDADTGGGALFDLGVYCVNAARYLFRAEPEEVRATAIIRRDDRFRDVDETTAALLRFPGDRVAQITVSQGLSSVSAYRLVGTLGDLRVEPAYDYGNDIIHHLTVDGETTTRLFPCRDQFAPELVYFSRCILEHLEPEPSGIEGLADVRVLCAILESAASQRAVLLPPFERTRRPDMSQEIRKPPVSEQHPIDTPSPAVH